MEGIQQQVEQLSLVDSADDTIVFAAQIKLLEEAGYPAKPKFIKLIKKTHGNVELVIKFLDAKKALNESMKSEKKDKKKEKRLQKLEKPSKIERKELKDKMKAEKKAEKELKKLEKPMRKQRPEKLEVVNREIPSTCSKIFLDGNNMLFVLAPIRNNCIHGGLAKAQTMLEAMARSFTKQSSTLEKLNLVFDSTNVLIDEERFRVYSARPAFATSDDSLVHTFEVMAPAERVKCCVITSDRGLIERLQALNVNCFGPKTWFQGARTVLSSGETEIAQQENLDGWADRWFSSIAK